MLSLLYIVSIKELRKNGEFSFKGCLCVYVTSPRDICCITGKGGQSNG